MKRPDETLVLDEALRKLRAGVPLDQVLAECGDFAAEFAEGKDVPLKDVMNVL